jgi:hypothetical protein
MGLKESLTFVEPAALAEASDTREAMTSAETSFDADRLIARRLGGRIEGDTAIFGFWTPELLDARVPAGDIFLEVLRPTEPVDLTRAHQAVTFERAYIPVIREDAFCFSAVTGMRAGTRESVGDFYALTWRDAEDRWRRILDPLAMSLPFGAMAPAELYDVAVDAGRARGCRLFRSAPRHSPAQVRPAHQHPSDPCPDRDRRRHDREPDAHYQRLAERVARDLPLEPADQLFLGYDAVQLLPVEPTTVYETGPAFWERATARRCRDRVPLLRPDTTNWGYDVVISAWRP